VAHYAKELYISAKLPYNCPVFPRAPLYFMSRMCFSGGEHVSEEVRDELQQLAADVKSLEKALSGGRQS